MSVRFFVLFLLLSGVFRNASAQVDTLFWFAAPDQPLDSPLYDRPIQLVLTAHERPSRVRIEIPANASFRPMDIDLPAFDTRKVDLTPWITQIETRPLTTVQNTGLRISGSQAFSAYYEQSSERNPDIFVLKGGNALGQEFFAVFQNEFPNRANNACYSAIDLVATEDATEVVVTPTAAHQGGPASTPFTIRLNRGQSYSIRAQSKLAAQRLTGSRLVSNKPIAVSVKDDFAEFIITPANQCADMIGDQLVPVDKLDTEYLLIPGGELHQGDRVFIVSPYDGNTVYVDGTPLQNLNSGQTAALRLTEPRFITSDAPVYVFHVTGMGCEMSGSLAPSMRCLSLRRTSFVRPNNEKLLLMVAAPAAAVGAFSVNGNAALLPAGAFSPVPGTNGAWSWARVEYSETEVRPGQVTEVENSQQAFILGVLNGANIWTGTRFGYFSSFNQGKLKILKLVDDIPQPVSTSGEALCAGNTLTLAVNPDFYRQIRWSTGETEPTLEVSNEGVYWVNAQVGGCAVSDTVRVTLTPNTLRGPSVFKRRNGELPGAFVVVVQGGAKPYRYRIDGGPWQDASLFADLTPKTYRIEVLDENGCAVGRDAVMD